jgi:hypothetical protein
MVALLDNDESHRRVVTNFQFHASLANGAKLPFKNLKKYRFTVMAISELELEMKKSYFSELAFAHTITVKNDPLWLAS